MYEIHPSLETPEEARTIWRYLSFDRFVSLITARALYFASSDNLGDAWEGWFPDSSMSPTLEPRIRQLSSQSRVHIGAAIRSHIFFNCWHVSDYESYPMWKSYAAAGSGIAVRSTIGRLIRSFKPTNDPVFIGRVSYPHEHEPVELDRFNALPPFFVKRPEFASENEVRAMIMRVAGQPVPGTTEMRLMPNPTSGFFVTVDLEELLQNIVIAPQLHDEWVSPLKELLRFSGLDSEIVLRSSLERGHPYQDDLTIYHQRIQTEASFDRVVEVCRECLGTAGDRFAQVMEMVRAEYLHRNRSSIEEVAWKRSLLPNPRPFLLHLREGLQEVVTAIDLDGRPPS